MSNNHRNSFNAIQKAALLTFVKEYYTAAGLNDTEFAVQASEHVGAPVNHSQVQYYRNMLGIQSNWDKRAAEKKEAAERRKLEREEMKKTKAAHKNAKEFLEFVDNPPEPLRDIMVRIEGKLDRLLALWNCGN